MPKTLHYRSGSVIYVRGDEAEKVFLLKSGTVNLSYQDIETNEHIHDLVQTGEFFGVKSALGRYLREENAMALQDPVLMVFTVPEFEAMIMANTRIIMKMLRVFSTQLRRIHRQLSRMMETKEPQNPELGLFGLGKYYFENKYFDRATYVFERYLSAYPAGSSAAQAAEYLRKAGTASTGLPGPASAEDPSPSEPDPPDLSPGNPAAEAYTQGLDLIARKNYAEAHEVFTKILEEDKDPEYTAKSSFETGRCLFLQARYEDCIKSYTAMIIKYPKHPDLAEALFFMGQSHEKDGRKDQAMVFYKKILSQSEDVKEETRVKAQQALVALGGAV
ncbi:MAG: tetratricopeptide repeat protein [Spirochaetaceae bacterium]|jgi:TolA-binding protein|nr:tetratricopeptide repeat protein [Spirochaetaceae bacterium]